jgi:hypothetical protein
MISPVFGSFFTLATNSYLGYQKSREEFEGRPFQIHNPKF